MSAVIKTDTFLVAFGLSWIFLCAVTVQITMPSGMSVTAKYSTRGRKVSTLDIAVYPLAEDFEHSEGLCGNFNDKDDDLPQGSDEDEPIDFIKSYMSVHSFAIIYLLYLVLL